MSLLASEPLVSYVDGQAFTGSGSFEVKDPHSPEKVLRKVSSVTASDVDKVIAAAQKALPGWKATPVPQRRKIIQKAADLLRERIPEYAKVEFEETTSSEGWAAFDISLGCDSLDETASVCTVALRGEIATTENSQRAYITKEPYGIVFGMAPWNAPVVLGQRACAIPIAAGNVAILKTSEMSPKTQLMIAQVFADAGLPAGVLNVIHVAPEDAGAVCEKIIAHPAVGKVNFTGSTRVGSIIGSLCGKNIKPVVLELGGKAPVVVRADADLKSAASAIMFGGWFHSGQICMASQTAIVHESIAKDLLAVIKEHATNVYASSDGSDQKSLRGLFTTASAQRVDEIVKDALKKGACVGAGKAEVKGNVVQPLMLADVTPEMRIYREEMFAPVFSLVTFKTDEEAIKIANDHEYGLAAAVWSADESAAYNIARQIDSGAVHINGASVHDSANMPHGGWKKSGFGRFNGIEGIREFTQIKTITINQPHPYPI